MPQEEPAWLKSKTYERSSPSQIKTFIECYRKWWYENVRKLRAPTKKAQARGTALHAVSEHFLEHGVLPSLQELVTHLEKGMREDEKDQPVVFEVNEESKQQLFWMLTNSFEFYKQVRAKFEYRCVEGEFRDETSYPVPVKGYADLVLHTTKASTIVVGTNSRWTKQFTYRVKVNEMLVGDHKSTSDWKYIKDEEQLRKDPQAIVYCQHFLKKLEAEGKTVDHICFLHHYILTADRAKPPEPRFTVIEFTREELAEGVAQISETLREMEVSYEKGELDVTRNPDACDMYGGCPHIDYCEEGEMNDFMKSLFTAPVNVPAAAKAPEPAPEAPAPAVETPKELPASLKGVDWAEAEAAVAKVVEEIGAALANLGQTEKEIDEVLSDATGIVLTPGAIVENGPEVVFKAGHQFILIDTVLVNPRRIGVTLEQFLEPIAKKAAELEKLKHHSLERFSNLARKIVHLGLELPAPDVLEVDSRTRLGGEFLSYVNEYACANPNHVILKGTR